MVDSLVIDGAGKPERVEALARVYERLYSQHHFIRKTIFHSASWAIALEVAVAGWCVSLSGNSKLLAEARGPIVLVLLGITVAATYAVVTYHAELRLNCRMIVSAERALGLYDMGAYLRGARVYSTEQESWGQGKQTGHVLRFYIIALVVVFLVSSIAIYSLPVTAP